MNSSNDLSELIAVARSDAQALQKQLSEHSEPTINAQDNEALLSKLESAAIDIHSLFEARMQHHFKRGPFSRKLKALLLSAEKTDLADRVHQYYLAINVLKHGKGASYRELLAMADTFIVMVPATDSADDTETRLVDVQSQDFFNGLCDTLQEAYQFLTAH